MPEARPEHAQHDGLVLQRILVCLLQRSRKVLVVTIGRWCPTDEAAGAQSCALLSTGSCFMPFTA